MGAKIRQCWAVRSLSQFYFARHITIKKTKFGKVCRTQCRLISNNDSTFIQTMQALKITGRILLFAILTVLTQIGGIIYLFSLSFHPIINTKLNTTSKRILSKLSLFLLLYFTSTFFIVPWLAEKTGRVQLPIVEHKNVAPQRFFLCLLNRNYVKNELKTALFQIADNFDRKFPGSKIYYLDANFPFLNRFPLLPHLSHNDGKKIDISLCYRDSESGNISTGSPSVFGYGVAVDARKNEPKTSCVCESKGHWQYGLINKLVPQFKKENYVFDEPRTATLLDLCVKNHSIKTIFIEPHLKQRLGLHNKKIKFHGCRAARHDDHIHLQLN
jgi:hypothetical protein